MCGRTSPAEPRPASGSGRGPDGRSSNARHPTGATRAPNSPPRPADRLFAVASAGVRPRRRRVHGGRRPSGVPAVRVRPGDRSSWRAPSPTAFRHRGAAGEVRDRQRGRRWLAALPVDGVASHTLPTGRTVAAIRWRRLDPHRPAAVQAPVHADRLTRASATTPVQVVFAAPPGARSAPGIETSRGAIRAGHRVDLGSKTTGGPGVARWLASNVRNPADLRRPRTSDPPGCGRRSPSWADDAPDPIPGAAPSPGDSSHQQSQ